MSRSRPSTREFVLFKNFLVGIKTDENYLIFVKLG